MSKQVNRTMTRTTDAPVLSPTHPLRTLLTRYGRYAARHVLTTLLVSVLVSAILIYPVPFLYTTDFTNGASNLPLHVWTDAQPLGERPPVEPDVIMRSIWVHGSYMKALDHQVLLGALELQDDILGPTTNFNPRRPKNDIALLNSDTFMSRDERDAFHVINGLTNQSWFFHSPLLYWACDAKNIEKDRDFLGTVNERKTQPTSVNVTLRHSIVFSGKKFEDRQLVAADALVITLLHLRDSPVGRQWERRTRDYAARTTDKWDVFPSDGRSTGSQLYEFQFRPISVQDTVLLSLAYVLTAAYFMLSLSKIRAVKSKLGLIITVVAQIAMSIVSSLTICAILRIDLSRIPRAAYPLVLMAMSLENVFRLINAVILTPSDHSTSSRIGQAFGETAHIALASVCQNLLILWGLSRVVSAGVSAFCTFAAIAILFDFFYLSTFFLSVLSVDVRRTELSDALEKAATRNNRPYSDQQPRQSLVDAILQGRIALSTRIAGTIVMLGFVIIAQWHFFDDAYSSRGPLRLFRFLWRRGDNTAPTPALYAQLHQARSPKSWLRLQDHETAKEVINVIKPWAHSYVARVYDPVIFVLKGADRNPPGGTRWFPDAVYDFAHHQLGRFIVIVLMLVASVYLLMNYLLWDEMAEVRGYDDDNDEPLITIKNLEHGHELDVAKLLVAPDSQLISVGLDRKIRVWNLRYDFASYGLENPRNVMDNPFPIIAMAVDNESNWLAILTTYRVLFWNFAEQGWGPSVGVDLFGQQPEAFFFGSTKKRALKSVVIVRRNGTLAEVWPDVPESAEYVICRSPLTSVVSVAERGKNFSTCGCTGSRKLYTLLFQLTHTFSALATASKSEPPLSLVTLSRRGCIHRVTCHKDFWVSTEVRLPAKQDTEPHHILSVQEFSAYLVVRSVSVDLVDLCSSKVIHTFSTEPMRPRSMKFVYSGQRRGPDGKGTVSSLTLAYLSEEDGDCVLQTYLPGEGHDNICVSDADSPTVRSSCAWAVTKQITRRIRNPGVWTPLRNGCMIGLRKARETPTGSPIRGRLPAFAQAGLRHRGVAAAANRPGVSVPPPTSAEETWEVWVITRLEQEGRNMETRPLVGPDDPAGLIIPDLGPVVKVGYGSIAVGFGNVVKVITVGHEWFDRIEQQGGLLKVDDPVSSRRRRGPGSRNRVSPGTFRYPMVM